MRETRDVFAQDLLKKARPYCAPVWMDSEDPLFILYTSGSTGYYILFLLYMCVIDGSLSNR